MSLQLIVGSGGSGKSTALFTSVIEGAIANPNENFYVIVPEQFTMHTQRQLVDLHPRHSITNIDVLSFQRLAYRVFEELGVESLEVLEETGKYLLLRRICQEKRGELKVLASSVERPGTITQIKSLISELMQYNIAPEDLRGLVSRDGITEVFREKTSELCMIYEEYRKNLSGRYITAEEILGRLIEVVDKSEKLRGATFAFDGFTGFTPLQYLLVKKLLPVAKRISVTITCQGELDLGVEPLSFDLFEMGKTMANRLADLADELKVPKEPIKYIGANLTGRFVPGGSLEHLERNLFKADFDEYKGEGNEDFIRFASLLNPRQELSYVAASIEEMVREKDLRYKDFAVVCPELDSYSHLVAEVFGKYNIPYFLDEKSAITMQPFLDAINALFQIFDENLSRHSVMSLLRTGLLDISPGEIDEFENYVLATNARGWKRYSNPFVVTGRYKDADSLQKINETREKFMAPILEIRSKFPKKKGSVADISKALYSWITGYEMEEKLQNRAQYYDGEGNDAKAREFGSIYAEVMDLMDKLVHILGAEEVDFDSYSQLLKTGFEAIYIRRIPPVNDGVTIGDLQRTRLSNIKVLFLIDARDGAIPKALDGGGILTQQDRETFFNEGLEIAPTDREKSFRQRFYLYFVMTQPSMGLVVTYPRVDGGGNATRPSYIVGGLQKIFPQVEYECYDELPLKYHLLSAESARDFFLKQLRLYADEKPYKASLLHYLSFLENEDEGELEAYLDAAFFVHRQEKISAAAVDAVYGKNITASISQLEQFSRCAYAYFLKYGLHLRPRDEYSFDSLEVGNFYHDVLCNYSLILKDKKPQGIDWFNVSDSMQREILDEAIKRAYTSFAGTDLLEEARSSYGLYRLDKALEQTVAVLTEQVRVGKFEPTEFEVSFTSKDDYKSLQVELDEMRKVTLTGKIDRVDLWDDQQGKVYIKIIDYKSSKNNIDLNQFYQGLQVQLVMYMGAVEEMVSKKNSATKAVPAAMFYYHIHRPNIDIKKAKISIADPEREKRLWAQIMKSLSMKGRVCDDKGIIEALDKGLETDTSSSVIPVRYLKDGEYDLKSTAVLAREDFDAMIAYARLQMKDFGENLCNGNVGATPYFASKNDSGCTYCDFKYMCGFEPGIEGYCYHNLKKMSGEEVLEKIRLAVAAEVEGEE